MVDIPNLPGVPPLPAYSAAVNVALLTADLVSSLPGVFGPQWGLFLDGESVIDAESVVTLDYKQEWTISDYPLEQGAFETYDKVQLPFEVRLRFATGGSDGDRQAFLQSIDDAANTLDLYDVVTPETVYSSVNITHYDYRRTSSNGVGLIAVDLTCVEVRVTATATFTNAPQGFSNTAAPSGASPANGGQVSPQTPAATVAQAFSQGGLQ